MNKYDTLLQEQRKYRTELCSVVSNYLHAYMDEVNAAIEANNVDNVLGEYEVMKFANFDCITSVELSDDGETMQIQTMYHDFDGHDHDYNLMHTSYARFDLWLSDKEAWKLDVAPYIKRKIDEAIKFARDKANATIAHATKTLNDLPPQTEEQK